MTHKKGKGKSGIPEQFVGRLGLIFGESLVAQIQKTFVERPTTFRVNTIKSNRQEVLDTLGSQGFKLRQITWYKDAFTLLNKSKRELTDTDLYKDGKIYIQSLASMVPPLILAPVPGDKVLDLTAAPGSKTSEMAAFMGRDGQLVANDNNKIRFFKLKHNMETLGVGDGTDKISAGVEGSGWQFSLRMEEGWKLCEEYPEYFDKILLDAPCSAEARFVADEPETYGYWKEHKIKEMAYKQRKLLLSAWQALKPGGILVYSTCTFAPEENEMQVDRLLEREGTASVLPAVVEGVKNLPSVIEWKGKSFNPQVKKTLRILPTADTEGFYVAKLIKAAM